MKRIFKAEPKVLNTKSIDDLNREVSELTNSRIPELLDADFKCASMALLNAVYFKVNWLHPFDESMTIKGVEFRASSSDLRQVDMMIISKRFKYVFVDSLSAHFITLPYEGELMSFNILFPESDEDYLSRDDDKSLINRINWSEIVKVRQELKLVSLKMPKFVINSKIEVC